MSTVHQEAQRRQSRSKEEGGEGKTYRTAKDDVDLWRDLRPGTLEKAEAVVKDVNNGKGIGWEQYAETWEDFISLENVVPVKELVKDFYQGDECPQRPTDIEHILNDLVIPSNGQFDHAQAGAISRCIRPDKSSNVWDCWHTTVYAYICGVSHLRQDPYFHPEHLSLTECRLKECEMFERKNGNCRPVSERELFTKKVAIKKAKGKTAKTDAEVSLHKMLEECKIATSQKPGYTTMDNLGLIKDTRKDLKLHHVGNPDLADQQLKSTLKMITNVFPGEKILGGLVAGITDFMIRFSDLEHVNHKTLTDFFGQQTKFSEYKTQNGYIKSNHNIKGRNKESISIRISALWNDWMFTYRKELCNNRKPITSKNGQTKYLDKMPPNYVKGVYSDIPKNKITVHCDNCSNTWEQSITKAAA